jgi:hypothetical protein
LPAFDHARRLENSRQVSDHSNRHSIRTTIVELPDVAHRIRQTDVFRERVETMRPHVGGVNEQIQDVLSCRF